MVKADPRSGREGSWTSTAVLEALPAGKAAGCRAVQEGAGEAVRPDRQPDLRAAPDGDRHCGLRDRHHAGALDLRAHARDRTAAGGRHGKRASVGDGRVGGRDHCAVRHAARARDRGVLRLGVVQALKDQGIDQFAVPPVRLFVIVVVGAIFGMLAAVYLLARR